MYQAMKIDFEITEELQQAIDAFLHHINEEDGHLEDCYRSEILFHLKEAFDDMHVIDRDQYELLKDYYVFKGIYKREQ